MASRLILSIILATRLISLLNAEQADEYQVKAAFLYNFAKFVQWPSGAFQNSDTPIAFCVLGPDPFGALLKDAVTGRTIDGRPLIVRHISSLDEFVGCHVLFVSGAGKKRSLPSLADGKTLGILTVGESDAPSEGVVINFRLEGGKVRFDINVGAAGRAQLRISSRLLSLAHLVEFNPR